MEKQYSLHNKWVHKMVIKFIKQNKDSLYLQFYLENFMNGWGLKV